MKLNVFFMIIIAIVVALFCATSLTDLHIQDSPPVEGAEAARKQGAAIREAAAKLLQESTHKTSGSAVSTSKIFAIILDEEISQAYFDVKVAMCRAYGHESPEEKAFEDLKLQLAEKKFAEEHGILPAEAEIMAFSQEIREVTESTEESYVLIKTFIEAAGMTWDQYWDVYKPTYEAPGHLTHIVVTEYIEQNNMASIDTSTIEYQIVSKGYQHVFPIH